MSKRICWFGLFLCVIAVGVHVGSKGVVGCSFYDGGTGGCNQTASVVVCGGVPNGAVAGNNCGVQTHRYSSPSWSSTSQIIGFPGDPETGYEIEWFIVYTCTERYDCLVQVDMITGKLVCTIDPPSLNTVSTATMESLNTDDPCT